ncbi:MAG: glycine--tRNA ligase subunit alpha/beta [Actinomycetia bacterium]|nr:glycine--tRNA ligase subunit alpha/beta [Actinomycetes bacterium]
MQDALIALTRYWTGHGCMIVQPMNTEVGAGTLNPATALRVLGPEPWRVAYPEPSVRPDDSRYGDNPNRLQTHTQFQVILKPEPGNQELYLGSLAAIGIDIAAHDVRFVEDNWASPALGAWGLGWEVWLDGLEITQFTYFQQSGGMTLDPVSVEITYGLERILMAIQGVSHFKDIAYAPGISYGEAFGQAEYEMSRYYLDDADIAANQGLFETYAAEASRLIELRLPVPAHAFVLKCSQAFNVLDARGAISTTQRAQAFTRTRNLSRSVAELWAERRAELGYPLGTTAAPPTAPEAASSALPVLDAPADLAFEIGTEELPHAEVTRAADAVRASLAEKLAATRLRHGDITVTSSPRRIAVIVAGVQPREDDEEQAVRGPRLTAAYDADGNPTRAALGFARAQGISVTDLRPLDLNGAQYAGIVRHVPGRPAAQVLSAVLPAVIAGLRAERNMRWNAPGLSYSRPIRWVVALLGPHVVPFTLAGIASGRVTRVHRTAPEPAVTITDAAGYLPALRAHAVEPDAVVRRSRIVASATGLAATAGGQVDPGSEQGVIDEVTNLVEDPAAILGSFDTRYLDLPADILTTVMKKHQRYLPVRAAGGGLLPHFITIANGDCDHDLVRAGNEAVLRARYEDAAFFWRADLATPLDDMQRHLAKLTFETRLGSVADRAARIAAIATAIAGRLSLPADERAILQRAAALAKFDLGSAMVTELSSLAGVMAREYARHAGETEAVAEALFEMELPRHAGDALPRSRPGAILALADRLDLLAGLFAIGAEPTGSSDPFGLRRAALGLLSVLRAHPGLGQLTITDGLEIAAGLQPVPADGHLEDALDFIGRRFDQLMLDQGHPAASIRAVRPLITTPARAEQARSFPARALHRVLRKCSVTGMGELTVRQARELLAGWAAEQSAVSARRDDVVRQAAAAGLSKAEVHRLAGIARSTIDRILAAGREGAR